MSALFSSTGCARAATDAHDRDVALNVHNAPSVQAEHGPGRRGGYFVSEAELRAHFRILQVIAERQAEPGGRRWRGSGRKLHNHQSDRHFLLLFDRELHAFAPRCLCGRGPLRVKAEINLKRYSCVCGVRFIEAR
ncbi:MAG TPA: hypothetical protein VF014_16310 [Casimicrobiaceae bacterium]|nr:hypothetical protein [Casimicrobiaceae bacterium]